MSNVSAAQVKGPHESTNIALPSERHRDFLQLLDANAQIRSSGYREAWGLQVTYARRLGCSTRTLRRIVADLREPGRDPRHLKVPPAGLRLGLIKVIPTHVIDPTTGRHRLGADRYVLLFPAGAAAGIQVQRATSKTNVLAAQVKGPPTHLALHSEGKASDHSHTATTVVEQGTGADALVLDITGRLTESAAGVDQLTVAKVLQLRPHRATVIDPNKRRDEAAEHMRFLEVARRGSAGPTYTTPAGKRIDLATCSTEELHEAEDALEAETVPKSYWEKVNRGKGWRR